MTVPNRTAERFRLMDHPVWDEPFFPRLRGIEVWCDWRWVEPRLIRKKISPDLTLLLKK